MGERERGREEGREGGSHREDPPCPRRTKAVHARRGREGAGQRERVSGRGRRGGRQAGREKTHLVLVAPKPYTRAHARLRVCAAFLRARAAHAHGISRAQEFMYLYNRENLSELHYIDCRLAWGGAASFTAPPGPRTGWSYAQLEEAVRACPTYFSLEPGRGLPADAGAGSGTRRVSRPGARLTMPRPNEGRGTRGPDHNPGRRPLPHASQ